MSKQFNIIPALDLLNYQVVRLHKGDFNQVTIYSDAPIATAVEFQEAGLRRLHIVDLAGARAGSPQQLDILKEICEATDLEVDFSGGIQTEADVVAAFEAGAHLIAIGSMAAREPIKVLQWVRTFGAERFLIAADLKGGRIATKGWEESSGQTFKAFWEPFAEAGLNRCFCTVVEQDGTLAGPATDVYRQMLMDFPGLELIASGGVANMQHIKELDDAGCWGVIVGRALYEGRITLQQLAAYVG